MSKWIAPRLGGYQPRAGVSADVPVSDLQPSDARVPMRTVLPRPIDRLEGLRGLEWGSVILDRNDNAWQINDYGRWGSARHEWTYTPAEFIAAITGPYTLIWEPT